MSFRKREKEAISKLFQKWHAFMQYPSGLKKRIELSIGSSLLYSVALSHAFTEGHKVGIVLTNSLRVMANPQSLLLCYQYNILAICLCYCFNQTELTFSVWNGSSGISQGKSRCGSMRQQQSYCKVNSWRQKKPLKQRHMWWQDNMVPYSISF